MNNTKLLSALFVAAVFCVADVNLPGGRFLPAAVAAPRRAEDAKVQTVNLPFVMRDDGGTQWDLVADGSINDGGNDLYDGGSKLFIDGNFQFNPNSNQVPYDQAHNEVVFGPVPCKGLSISRRVAVDAKASYIRYAEVLENPTAQPVRMQVRIYFNMGGSVQNVQPFMDDKKKQNQIGMAFGDNNNSLAIVGAGRGSKIVPRFVPQQGTDNVDVFYDVEVPAKQTMVIVHIESRRTSIPDCLAFMQGMKDKDYLKDLPRELARKVANFSGGTRLGGDLELLRGDLTDIVEVRGGDQLRGTLKEEKFRLKTSYGIMELPAERILGMVNVGEYHPRQLIVTRDGEILGGELEKKSISIELSSRQVTTIPVAQVSRFGYRKKAGDGEDWTFDKPMITLRTGERIAVSAPEGELEILTRCGLLRIKSESIHTLTIAAEDTAVHQVVLSDGSRLSGLVSLESFAMKQADTGQTIAFPTSRIAKLQYQAKLDDADDATPVLMLANDDQLVGTVAGILKLQTAFGLMDLNSGEIKQLTHAKGADVQIVLWDQTTVSGQLQDQDLVCDLKCGVQMKVPVSLVGEYNQPRPTPSAPVIESIQKLGVELNSDDFATREEAQHKLTTMGPVVIKVLQKMRDKQTPEGQTRIDAIIKALESPPPKPIPGLPNNPDAIPGEQMIAPNPPPDAIRWGL